MSTSLTERIAQEHATVADVLPAGAVARARRRRALDALLAGGLPTSRDENWRYANLRPLERVRFAPARLRTDGAAAGTTAAEPLAAERAAPEPRAVSLSLPPPVPGFARYVFIDGVFAPEASSPVGAEAPVGLKSVGIESPVAPGSAVQWGSEAHVRVSTGAPLAALALDGEPRPEAAFALLNEAFALDGLRIEVGAAESRESRSGVHGSAQGSAPTARIEVVFAASAPARLGASYPRLSILATPHARLELIERHLSAQDEPSFIDAAVEVRAQEGAVIDHYRVQQLGARAVWLDTLAASVGRSAAYRVRTIALGAQAARSTLHVRLEGEAAELGLHAVATADRQQVLDTQAVVEHRAPRTRTEEVFRGVAAGRARVAFNGRIIVQPGSHGADSSQTLRGLLAGAEAEIDVRPQLEIYTDEVRCSHGATAGKLDETMLFYLLSRGLDRDIARQLLKWAFLEDVVSKIGIGELRRQIEASLAGQLKESEALKELL